MATSYNAKSGILEAIKYFVLAIILCFTLAPFLFMFLSSLRPGSEMVQNGLTVNLDVRSMTLNDYVAMFKYNDGIYFLWYKNSVLITGIQTLLVLLFCSMVGYGLAVYNFRIVCPVMLPAFASIMILQAMNSWNGFVWPLIVLRSDEQLTLPIGLMSLLTPYGNNYDVLLAGSVISIVPIIILFLLNQKAFITGLTVGSVKG